MRLVAFLAMIAAASGTSASASATLCRRGGRVSMHAQVVEQMRLDMRELSSVRARGTATLGPAERPGVSTPACLVARAQRAPLHRTYHCITTHRRCFFCGQAPTATARTACMAEFALMMSQTTTDSCASVGKATGLALEARRTLHLLPSATLF